MTAAELIARHFEYDSPACDVVHYDQAGDDLVIVEVHNKPNLIKRALVFKDGVHLFLDNNADIIINARTGDEEVSVKLYREVT